MAETAGGIYYPTKESSVDLENDLPKMAQSVEERFDGIKGDATLAEDGTLTVANHGLLPVGALLPAALSSAPTGFLLCDGSAVSRTTYAALFAAIATAYGAGNGSTTFNVPDLRGRVPVGVDGSAGRLSANDELGKAAGEEKHTLAAGEMPAHAHGVNDPGHAHLVDVANFNAWSANGPQETTVHVPNGLATHASLTGISIQSAGGGGAHNNMQPYQVVNYLIKT